MYSELTKENSVEIFLKENLSSQKGEYKRHFKSIKLLMKGGLESMHKNYLSQQNSNVCSSAEQHQMSGSSWCVLLGYQDKADILPRLWACSLTLSVTRGSHGLEHCFSHWNVGENHLQSLLKMQILFLDEYSRMLTWLHSWWFQGRSEDPLCRVEGTGWSLLDLVLNLWNMGFKVIFSGLQNIVGLQLPFASASSRLGTNAPWKEYMAGAARALA